MNNIKTFENFNNQDIFKYVKNNDIESVKNYINSGYDLNIQNDVGGDTTLIWASRNNKIEIVKILLNAGAYIDKQTNNGDTALIKAAFYDNRGTVEILLDYGADEFILNDENKEYFTQKYPTNVYSAISHNYKKSFTEFIKDHNIKIKK